MAEEKGLLTEAEAESLILRYVENIAPEGATEDELEALVKWANDQRIGALMVEMILDGQIVVESIEDGVPLCARPPAAGKRYGRRCR